MTMHARGLGGRGGFTLVELGLLIALGGATAGVIGPSIARSQRANAETRSQFVHHTLAVRQGIYIQNHAGAFTGPNTSGAEWNKDLISIYANKGVETLEFDTAGGNPTSQGDWITPLVGDEYGFSANRAIRTQQKFSRVWDPTADRMVDTLYTGSGTSDQDQFVEVLMNGGFRQRSFLQMRSFTNYSSEHPFSNVVRDNSKDIGYIERFAVQSENDAALSPEGYTPRIWNVGLQLSDKVMFADGTRYYDEDTGLDISIATTQFGTSGNSDDSDPGPIWNSSVAYGRAFNSAPDQTNLDLSYRKSDGAGMYVTMFDGSLKYMTREESWTDPTPWYPSGSVWNGNNATPEAQAWVKKNLPGGVIH